MSNLTVFSLMIFVGTSNPTLLYSLHPFHVQRYKSHELHTYPDYIPLLYGNSNPGQKRVHFVAPYYSCSTCHFYWLRDFWELKKKGCEIVDCAYISG